MMNSADTLVPLSTIDSLGKHPELRMLNDIKGEIEIIFSISIIWLQNFLSKMTTMLLTVRMLLKLCV